jgi:hypothetical protein
VCVNLSSGLRGPFPILRLTKACWTCPPPRNLTTILKTKLGPTQIRPSPVPTRQALLSPRANRFRVMGRQGRPDPWVAPTSNSAVRPPFCTHPVCIRHRSDGSQRTRQSSAGKFGCTPLSSSSRTLSIHPPTLGRPTHSKGRASACFCAPFGRLGECEIPRATLGRSKR